MPAYNDAQYHANFADLGIMKVELAKHVE